ncbi:unnamed protein product, partial [Mesorhabditis belari]|uniref:Uncharacterized protein n=1 Tax=Mesorhabditis belari TaxID=2138241 RepID=A0AAF3EEE6_9BILA
MGEVGMSKLDVIAMMNEQQTILHGSEGEPRTCQICYDLSDGLHFGTYSCRACAAFFRRTVTLKLDYICRADAKCSIHKSARNMCRHCRYQKCLTEGMQITAVQQSRDGIGKRKEKDHQASPGYVPSTRQGSSPLGGIWTNHESSAFKKPNNGDILERPSSSDAFFYNRNELFSATAPVAPIANMMISPPYSSFTPPPQQQMKILPKMHEGYLHFLSIRKATNSLVDNQSIQEMFEAKETLRMSNFESSKKVCQMEAHLVTSVVNNYFHPFAQIDFEDKVLLFKNFFCYLSHVDRAYQSYRMFGTDENDDRIIMPDGGYIKLSELQKYYENAESVKADPKEAATIFRPAMAYILNTIIGHMRRIQITDYEYLAIIALFLWQEGVPGLKQETIKTIFETHDQVFRDLHIYYQQQGYDGPTTTSKMASLMLLIPKMARSVTMIRENFELAELFNIFEVDVCCKSFKNADYR